MEQRKCIAEALGTFLLVFFGCGAIVFSDFYPGVLGHLGVSLTFGLTVATVIYTLGPISGAHINPAVTIGFYFAGKISKKNAFKQYLAYHEGWGNYKYYKKNKKVIGLAKKVEKQSNIYKNQLSKCKNSLNKNKYIIF